MEKKSIKTTGYTLGFTMARAIDKANGNRSDIAELSALATMQDAITACEDIEMQALIIGIVSPQEFDNLLVSGIKLGVEMYNCKQENDKQAKEARKQYFGF